MSEEMVSFGKHQPLVTRPGIGSGRTPSRDALDLSLVRIGHDGLVLPMFATAHDTRMQRPFSDTHRWLHRLVEVNPDRQYGSELHTRNISFQATSQLGMKAVETHVHTVMSSLVIESEQDDATLRLTSRGDQPFLAYAKGIPIYFAERNTAQLQQVMQDKLQPVVQDVLADLGYGSPQDFAANAVRYEDIRRPCVAN